MDFKCRHMEKQQDKDAHGPHSRLRSKGPLKLSQNLFMEFPPQGVHKRLGWSLY